MIFIDVTDPITLLLLLSATVLLIFLARELKKPYIAAMPLAVFLALVSMHAFQLGLSAMQDYKNALFGCITYDCIMIFLSFFSYLWIDDIAAKEFKRKSLDNSLDWFWNNV